MDQSWFVDATERSRHIDELYATLSDAMTERSTNDWLATFKRIDVPHSRVNSLGDLLDDPHLAATEFFAPTDGTVGRVRSVPQPVKVRGSGHSADRAAPSLGGDAAAILAELGYDENAVTRFEQSGIVGTLPKTAEG